MADNKKELCPDKLFASLAFTAIFSLALIISGIILFSFPTAMSEKDVVTWNHTIEYTHCKYVRTNYESCKDFFQKETDQNRCQCSVETNLTGYLRGKVFMHCVLEIEDQGSKIDNTSVTTFIDEITNTSGQCDSYNTQETPTKETCKAIPDSIFNDDFTLFKYITKNKTEKTWPTFKKTVRWSLDKNNSTTGLQNKITVEMNTAKNLSDGLYLYLITFYRNENIGRRYLILSTQNEVVNVYYNNSRVISIIALAVGLVLAVASIVLIVIWIQGVKSNTLTPVPADEPAANNRVSGTLPEERPLAAHVNNEQS